MIMLLVAADTAATAAATPWWQTALIALASSATGSGLTLLGVWINGRQTDRREARKAEAEDNSKRIEQERNAIADLIALTLPWSTSIHTRYLVAWCGLHDPRRKVKQEVWDKAITDSEKFAAAMWKARVTVQHPAARTALEELSGIYREFTRFVARYEQDHKHADDKTDDAKLDKLEADLDAVCRSLEQAALALDAPTLPQPRSKEVTDSVDASAEDVSH